MFMWCSPNSLVISFNGWDHVWIVFSSTVSGIILLPSEVCWIVRVRVNILDIHTSTSVILQRFTVYKYNLQRLNFPFRLQNCFHNFNRFGLVWIYIPGHIGSRDLTVEFCFSYLGEFLLIFSATSQSRVQYQVLTHLISQNIHDKQVTLPLYLCVLKKRILLPIYFQTWHKNDSL